MNILIIDALILLAFTLLGVVLMRAPRGAEALAAESADWLARRRVRLLARSGFHRTIDPFVRIAARWARVLGLQSHRKRVGERLLYAGNPWGYSPAEYVGYGMVWSLLAGGFALALLIAAGVGMWPLALLFAVFTYVVVMTNLSTAAMRRRVQLDRQMPYFLDLISLSMGAGATFNQACRSIAYGPIQGPLEEELARVLQEAEAGSTLSEALAGLERRTDSKEVASMVEAVRQGEDLGTPLTEVFELQAEMNRFRRTQKGEQEGGKLPNRLAIPNTLMMISSLLIVFGPIIVKAVRGRLM